MLEHQDAAKFVLARMAHQIGMPAEQWASHAIVVTSDEPAGEVRITCGCGAQAVLVGFEPPMTVKHPLFLAAIDDMIGQHTP